MTGISEIRWTTAFLDYPRTVVDEAVAYWRHVTGAGLSGWRADHRFVTLLPPDGDAYLRVQAVDSDRHGCHLDLHVDDVVEAAAAAVDLGARAVLSEPGLVVLRSPAGLPFCFVDHEAEAMRPTPRRWAGGHSSLLDQLCLDLPPEGYETECAFWAELTGWQPRDGSRPEFRYLVRPEGLPLRLLLQRLDDAPAGEPARAHVDLACDDMDAEAARHEAFGATVVRRTGGWVTLREPVGMDYCVTGRNALSGLLPQG